MLDDSHEAVQEVAALIKWVSSRNGMPEDLRDSVIERARCYLMAIAGDVDAAIDLFSDCVPESWEAQSLALDDLMNREPRGLFHAAKTCLERIPQSHYCRIPCEEPGPIKIRIRDC